MTGGVPQRTTARLLLRGFTDADQAPFVALNRDRRVMRHLQGPWSPRRSAEMVERIEACWAARGWGLWAVEVRETRTFVGWTGLWPAPDLPGGPGVEVGWRLARDAWGHGYAPEAAREALTYAFADVGLDEVVSYCAAGNAASLRVMAKMGLRRDAARDFDSPRVDPITYPELVTQLVHATTREAWRARVAAGREHDEGGGAG